MAEPDIVTQLVTERITGAENALSVSKQCQQNGLLCEAVMSTVEALEHIEQGLSLSPINEHKDNLENLQFKANCLLDCLIRMSQSKEKVDELTALIDLMSSDDSGLVELHTSKVVNYSQCDSSRNIIYSLDENLLVALLKVIRPRLVYFLQVRTEDGVKVYTIPLREETGVCIDNNRLEIQLPDYSVDGFAIIRLLSSIDLQQWIALFDENLIAYNSLEVEEVPEGGTAYPHGLVRGASTISYGLKRGAEKTGEFLTRGVTPFVISKLARAESVEVSDSWRTTAVVAKNVTTTAASFSSRVADKLGSATMAVGRFLAPHAQVAGSKLLVHTTGVSEEHAATTMNGVLNFTAGAVTAVATVFEGIEESVKTIGTSVGESSGKIIEHRYGPEAAGVATDTLETIGNVYTISKHTKILQPKGMLKTAVKNTGKGILREISTNNNVDDMVVPSTSAAVAVDPQQPLAPALPPTVNAVQKPPEGENQNPGAK